MDLFSKVQQVSVSGVAKKSHGNSEEGGQRVGVMATEP